MNRDLGIRRYSHSLGLVLRAARGCKIPNCLHSYGQRGTTINFDIGQALTITLIGVGTAFGLLAVLSILTAVLPHLTRAILTNSTIPATATVGDDKEKRNKALAATIAVNIVLSEGKVSDERQDSDQVAP